MSTIFSRNRRRLGAVAAGAALCLGMITVPSAWAADPVYEYVTVDPAAAWVQLGTDQEIVVSSTDAGVCTGILQAMLLKDGQPVGGGEIPAEENGEWEFTVFSAATDSLDGETGGGLAAIRFNCIDPSSGPIWTETVPFAVTGLSVDNTTVPLGEDTTIQVDGFQPNETVTITLSDGAETGATPGEIGRGVADANGHADIIYRIPEKTGIDTYVFTVEGASSGRTFVAGLTVFSEEETTEVTPPPAPKAPLVEGGGTAAPAENLPLLGFSVVLLMGAGLVLVAGRRVRQH